MIESTHISNHLLDIHFWVLILTFGLTRLGSQATGALLVVMTVTLALELVLLEVVVLDVPLVDPELVTLPT